VIKKKRNLFEKKLDLQLKRSKVSYEYEPCRIPYLIAGHYTPDWRVRTPNGYLFIEGKGYFRPEAKRKLIAVKRANPNIDLRIVFYSSIKSNIRWAERHGFRYAIGSIPKDWLNGF
jgi:hypothetical protein